MTTETLIRDFNNTLEFTPVDGIPDASLISLKSGTKIREVPPEMSKEEWDKFEKDIEEAFEKLP